jgi:3-phosphoshikimate 1-carboxyvinyltransferase
VQQRHDHAPAGGILAGQSFVSTLTETNRCAHVRCNESQSLWDDGGAVSSVAGGPLTIEGRDSLTAIDYELLIASAQVKSCILLAALTLRKNDCYRE